MILSRYTHAFPLLERGCGTNISGILQQFKKGKRMLAIKLQMHGPKLKRYNKPKGLAMQIYEVLHPKATWRQEPV
jgi:hypothetical protein